MGVNFRRSYKDNDVSWSFGNKLAAYSNNTFSYDAQGRRVSKNDIVYEYNTQNQIFRQSNGIKYFYDNNSSLYAFLYDENMYFYKKDLLGNVIEILDTTGTTVVKYVYDAWGNHKVLNPDGTENTSALFIGNINPIRYRGYYYDVETGLYFLQSRYYDPQTGRFISMDDISYLDPETINGLNLYAYCLNNPVMYLDGSGHLAISTFLIGLAVSFVVTWAAGEIFGHQLVGGIGSTAGGASAIATGISLLAYGPVGWVIGGIAIIAGAASIAFGTAEIQEHFTGNNWIQDSFGWSNGLYNGLYFASNIVASVASVSGQVYKHLTTTTKLFRAVNSAEANSIAKTRMFSEGSGQMEGKFFATQKSHALQWGAKLDANKIVSIRVPKSALSHPSVTNFNYRLDGIGPAYYFSDLDFLNSIFHHLRFY